MSIRGAVSSGQLGYDIALIEFQVLGKKEKKGYDQVLAPLI